MEADGLRAGATPAVALTVVSLALLAGSIVVRRSGAAGPLAVVAAFSVVFTAAVWGATKAALWILAALSFRALREYFSLVDLRLSDRGGVWIAYLSIPFMTYLIQIDWYGMFIISIPVYTFLLVPFVVVAGDPKGTGAVLSVGAIDFGLFLLVYCVGHIGYLMSYAPWMAILVVAQVALVDAAVRLPGARPGLLPRVALAAPATVTLALLLAPWSGIPRGHSVVLGLLIPALVAIGTFTIRALERDLGIPTERPPWGRGRELDALRPYLFAGPVAFHYLRWFLKL